MKGSISNGVTSSGGTGPITDTDPIVLVLRGNFVLIKVDPGLGESRRTKARYLNTPVGDFIFPDGHLRLVINLDAPRHRIVFLDGRGGLVIHKYVERTFVLIYLHIAFSIQDDAGILNFGVLDSSKPS